MDEAQGERGEEGEVEPEEREEEEEPAAAVAPLEKGPAVDHQAPPSPRG